MKQVSCSVEIFCCYAHEDLELLRELKIHLSPLLRAYPVTFWDDGDIVPGTDWVETIKLRLNRADIVLLLISADLFQSDYCYTVEMQRAVERHRQEKTHVIPIILRPVVWQCIPIGDIKLNRLQALPKSLEPVTSWHNHDEAWKDVVEGIERVINELLLPSIPNVGGTTRTPGVSSPQARETVPSMKLQHRIPRRAIILGLGGLLAVGSSIFFLTLPQEARVLSFSSHPSAINTSNSASLNNRIYVYTGLTDAVNAVGWSPDGKCIAAGSKDKTIQVWEANSGNHIATYTGNSPVTSLAWSPDSRYIVVGYTEGLAQVWDTRTRNKTVNYTKHTSSITFVVWSSDKNYIASGSTDTTVQVWNAFNGKEVLSYTNQTNFIKCMAWSDDGNYIASGSDNILQVWNAHSANKIAYIATGTGMGIGPISVTWSTNNNYIAIGLESGKVQIWKPTSREKVAEYAIHSGGVFAVAWSLDGKHIASGGSDTIAYIWDAKSGNKTTTYNGHSDKVNSISWSPDSKRVASASDDKTVQVWQAR
jgi:WD40 repeat protein